MTQISRNAVIASAASNKAKRITTSATTWGQLKTEISELLTGELDAVVKPGNVTLREDSSVLPTGEFNVYLIPQKNKAGLSEKDANSLGFQVAKAIKEGTKKASKEEADALKNAIVNTIKAFFAGGVQGASNAAASSVAESVVVDSELTAALDEARSMSR